MSPENVKAGVKVLFPHDVLLLTLVMKDGKVGIVVIARGCEETGESFARLVCWLIC